MQFELGLTRNGLIDSKNQIAQTIPKYSSSKEFLRQNSEMIDDLVRKAFQNARTQIRYSSVCLVAVGGYGRAELAPHSDVDLLLLYASSQKEELPPLIEKILYPLWDLGLDVSCSSRSVDECLKMAQSDLQVKTSLIDARYLDGEYNFFRNLQHLFIKKILHRKVQKFAAALSQDLHCRRQKYEDPAYVLEPNLKDGGGGLRDFQIGRWIIRAKYKTDRWDSILFPDHSRMLDKSIQFLWAVRNHLHLLTGRRQDDLTFELQEKIAPLLGFTRGTLGIEEMMREYHLSTQKISNFIDDVLDRALYDPTTFKSAILFFRRKKLDSNFVIANGEFHLLSPMAFKKDPTQVMTLFQHCQIYGAKVDFRIEEAIMEALPFIDDRFRSSDEVNQRFLSILREGKGMKIILMKMHELGLLSRYIPEFSQIEGKVHYDLYHVHPVDIHSILSVEELGKLKDGFYEKEYPLLTSLMREMNKPEILFLATFLHDIGKGVEGNHSLIGAEIGERIASRMGISAEDSELIGSLIRHHLLMVEIAFRRDLHDEQVILNFANEIKNIHQLKRLYLLTFADIQAVGPEAWTSWKDTLLMELFLKTSHFFERDALVGSFLKRDEMMKKLHELLPMGTVSEYVEYLPDRYLSCYPAEKIVQHIELARRIESEFLTVEWEIERGVQAKVTVCTKDRYGLFSKIAGSMFLNRLSILEAQIHTWENGIALDTFWVEDATQDIERRLQQFEKSLKEILIGNVPLKDLLSKMKESNGIKQKFIPRVPEEIKINNQDSDFFTIVEIIGEDRLGILYELTQALTDHGCDIHFARVSTLGNRIVDVFYIQDEFGEKLQNKNQTDQLRKTVQSVLAPSSK